MVRVTPMEPFAAQFFGGTGALEVEAGTLFALVDALDRIGPGFAEVAGMRAAFAVDGAMQTDWSASLGEDAQVTLFQRVAGGDADA